MRPELIKVGHMDFRVLYLTEEEWDEDPDLDNTASGMTENYTGMIWVKIADDRQNEAVTKEVLFHEILHAIFFVSCLTFVKIKKIEDWEEESIQRLTPMFLAVLRDNPDLSRYLTSFDSGPENGTSTSSS